MATWRELIRDCAQGDVIIYNTLTEEELDIVFNDDYGNPEGLHFTAWSNEYVYFPVCYDGAEWVGRVPRMVGDFKTGHIGGY